MCRGIVVVVVAVLVSVCLSACLELSVGCWLVWSVCVSLSGRWVCLCAYSDIRLMVDWA